MEDCIFCKIVKGEIPCARIYEDIKVIAFLDIMPANKGHCLIVPKQHYKSLTDIDDETLAGMTKATKKIAKAISLSLGVNCSNIIMNNGKEAGQLVMHAHMHVIPRFKNDGHAIKWEHMHYEKDELKDYSDKIRKFV